KAVFVLRGLREAGHRVRVIPTESALEFVGRPTWEALSGEPVTTSVFAGATAVDHVALGRSADLVVVAPATADLLSRAATGRVARLRASPAALPRCWAVPPRRCPPAVFPARTPARRLQPVLPFQPSGPRRARDPVLSGGVPRRTLAPVLVHGPGRDSGVSVPT